MEKIINILHTALFIVIMYGSIPLALGGGLSMSEGKIFEAVVTGIFFCLMQIVGFLGTVSCLQEAEEQEAC